MRNKVIYRIAAGTCSICITYGLIIQGINRGNTSSDALAVTPSAIVTEEQPANQNEDTSGDTFPANGRTSGKNRGGRGHHRFDDSEWSSGSNGNSTTEDTGDEDKKKTVSSDDQGQQSSNNSSQNNTTGDPPTLQKYLSTLRCGGCGHNCSLLSPRCMKGRSKVESATYEYQQTYGG